MNRITIIWHVFAVLFLLGFGLAAVTDGAPVAVACGTLGLLGLR